MQCATHSHKQKANVASHWRLGKYRKTLIENYLQKTLETAPSFACSLAQRQRLGYTMCSSASVVQKNSELAHYLLARLRQLPHSSHHNPTTTAPYTHASSAEKESARIIPRTEYKKVAILLWLGSFFFVCYSHTKRGTRLMRAACLPRRIVQRALYAVCTAAHGCFL